QVEPDSKEGGITEGHSRSSSWTLYWTRREISTNQNPAAPDILATRGGDNDQSGQDGTVPPVQLFRFSVCFSRLYLVIPTGHSVVFPSVQAITPTQLPYRKKVRIRKDNAVR
ncbi:hypothetical protein Bpfe_017768, partial [Biomphalaria pfeifferi]